MTSSTNTEHRIKRRKTMTMTTTTRIIIRRFSFLNSLVSLLLLLLLLLVVVVPPTNGIDIGKIFQRYTGRGNAAGEDPDAQANQVLSHKTACNKELAQSLVLLGEQKTVAEEALILCREHRAKAREDVEYLVKKVDIQKQDLDQADERCQEKLQLAKDESDREMQEIKWTLNQTESVIADIKDSHAQVVHELQDNFQSTLEAIKTDHQVIVEQLSKDHQIIVDDLKVQLTEKEQKLQDERQTMTANLQTLKAEHRQAMQAQKEDHVATLKATEEKAKKAKEQIEVSLKSQLDNLAKQATACDKSLKSVEKELRSLTKDHKRALEVCGCRLHVTMSLFRAFFSLSPHPFFC